MRQRKLGRTGLAVGEIGLGTEHLNGQGRGAYEAIIGYALDHGVTYLDVLFPFPAYRDNIAAAIRGRRDQIVIAGHVGSVPEGDQTRKTHDPGECRPAFDDLLRRLGTDHVDVLMLQWVDGPEEFEGVVRPGGLADLATRLRTEGKARAVGLSTHIPGTVLAAAASGRFDLVMHPINLANAPELIAATRRSFEGAGAEVTTRVPLGLDRLGQACRDRDVALVAMKPFGGGPLLQPRWPFAVTAARCLAYVLDQPDVACAVAGARSIDEIRENLRYPDLGEEEKGYRLLLGRFRDLLAGGCTYCNHCQPCPEGINVGETLRLIDMADALDMAQGGGFLLREQYAALSVKASACTACGECSARCPFGVDVPKRMDRAVQRLERRG